MKKTFISLIVLTFCLIISSYSFAGSTHSGQALKDSGQASYHASKSAAHAIVASGQVVSAATAVPFAIGGSLGAVSNEIANDLLDAATAPLEITDQTVTVGPPPGEALQ